MTKSYQGEGYRPAPARGECELFGDRRDNLIPNKDGTARTVPANAATAIRELPELTGVLAHNEFADKTMAISPAPWDESGAEYPREWTDKDDLRTTERLQRYGSLWKRLRTTGFDPTHKV